KRDGENERAGGSMQVDRRHPRPGECGASPECNLAFCDAKRDRPEGFDEAAEVIEDLPRILVPGEEFIHGHVVVYAPGIEGDEAAIRSPGGTRRSPARSPD